MATKGDAILIHSRKYKGQKGWLDALKKN